MQTESHPRLLHTAPLALSSDLQAMHRLLQTGRKGMHSGAATYFIHPGDVSWWLFYPPLNIDTTNRVFLWDDPVHAGEILGFAFIDDSEFTVFLHPGLEEDQLAKRRGWATQACQERAHKTGKKHIYSGFISENDTAAIRYYQASGFAHDPAYDYACFKHDLKGLTAPDLPVGFRIGDMRDEGLVSSRAAAQYGAFQSKAAWEDYLARYERFTHTPVYTPTLDRIVLSPDGQVAAFCINWLDAEIKTGLFEPVGTHPNFTGRGLSKALLRHALLEMKAGGMQEAIVLTNHDNDPAVGLYHTVGFKDNGRLLLFSKEIRLES